MCESSSLSGPKLKKPFIGAFFVDDSNCQFDFAEIKLRSSALRVSCLVRLVFLANDAGESLRAQIKEALWRGFFVVDSNCQFDFAEIKLRSSARRVSCLVRLVLLANDAGELNI